MWWQGFSDNWDRLLTEESRLARMVLPKGLAGISLP